MSPLFMETGYEPNSPGSISAEDCNSHTAGSEREGEGQQVGKTGRKRREKNRDAARKSRKKQTERADVLHEELQCLERSNSALQKEIAELKKDLLLYTTALERHEPHCRLRASASNSSSSTCHSMSPSVGCRTGSSPPTAPSQGSDSTLLAAPSLSTSLNSSLGFQTLDSVENTHLSPSTFAPTTTTLTSSSGSSTDVFHTSSSNPVTVPCSLSFSTLPAPHSLFSVEPVITSRPMIVTPVSSRLLSNPVPSSALSVAAHPQSVRDTIPKTSLLSADACFFTPNSDSLDAFLTKQTSFITASSNVMSPYSHVASANVGLEQGCDTNTNLYSRNPNNSSQSCSLQDSAPQSFSGSSQASLEPFPAFALKPSYSQQIAPNPASMLSLLTVPSPLNVPQTTSNRFDGHIVPSPPSLLLSCEPLRDPSLSELLEVNDWILS